MRIMRFMMVGVLLALANAAEVEAQAVELYVPDTAVVILTGDSARVDLRVISIPSPYGVSSYSFTIFLDDSRVTLIRADTVWASNLPAPTITTGAGQVTLTASGTGTGSSSPTVARVWFKIDGAAVEGSLVSIKVNSLLNSAGTNIVPSHSVGVLPICQANRVYGDVDVSRKVTSRDALITLTAAVGITVTGFELQWGDVDLDGQLDSRDALFVLSAAVGVGIPSNVHAAENVANRCGPLHLAPSDLAYFRNSDIYLINSGDTLPQQLARGTAPPPYAGDRVSWAPDGIRLAYSGNVSAYGYDIIAIDRTGAKADTLSRSVYSDLVPAWSPDGTRIAFVSTRTGRPAVYVMDADGSNQVAVTPDTMGTIQSLAWSSDGTRLAFTGYSMSACCNPRLWGVDASGFSGYGMIHSVTAAVNASSASSSAGSDSVAYLDTSKGRIYWMADPDTAGAPAIRMGSGHEGTAWMPAGIGFRSNIVFPYNFYLQRNDGRTLQLTRIPEARPTSRWWVDRRPRCTSVALTSRPTTRRSPSARRSW